MHHVRKTSAILHNLLDQEVRLGILYTASSTILIKKTELMSYVDMSLSHAGICAQNGYSFAVATYHFAMTMALSAHAETLRYHQQDESLAVQQAASHMKALQVLCGSVGPVFMTGNADCSSYRA